MRPLFAKRRRRQLKNSSQKRPTLVLLDDDAKGGRVGRCAEVRRVSNIPIIMLTAKGDTFDKVLGLELGADDHMVKPFESKEPIARITGGHAPV